jgi:hypothetical protein
MNFLSISYDIYVTYLTVTGLYPVAAVQYTFTHTQYTGYRKRNIHNSKKLGTYLTIKELGTYTTIKKIRNIQNNKKLETYIIKKLGT